MNRRTFLKRVALGLAALAAAPPAGYAYGRYAEPKWLELTEATLTLKRLPEAWDGVRIVQFSDVHLGFHYEVQALERLIEKINRLQSDIVVFTGDMVDDRLSREEETAAAAALTRLQSKHGVFAVLGNHDYYASRGSLVERLLAAGGCGLLRNAAVRLGAEDSPLWIAGVEDQAAALPNLPRALENVPPEAFTLLLSHCPDFADIALRHPVDLQLSGHSHGGQVRLPFVGEIVTPNYGRKYVQGHYALGGGKLQLYTNRGIGMSVYPLRLFCRPELTVLTLKRG